MDASESQVPCTVYVLDDDTAVLKMVQSLIETIQVPVRAFSRASEFLAAYAPGPCECLICDMRMPELSGLEVQSALLARQADLPIIFITGFAEVGVAVEAMKRGAFDYIEKPFSAHVLLEKVQRALARSRELAAARRQRTAISARFALLTQKEQNIARLVVAGKSSRDIALELGVTTRTVDNHRARIMEKLHVHSAVEMVSLLLQHGRAHPR